MRDVRVYFCHESQTDFISLLTANSTGHLSGILPESAERALLLAFVATTLLFAGRKYTQPIKDDIGDKSVFTWVALYSFVLLECDVSCSCIFCTVLVDVCRIELFYACRFLAMTEEEQQKLLLQREQEKVLD
jgi:hypothetical protein